MYKVKLIKSYKVKLNSRVSELRICIKHDCENHERLVPLAEALDLANQIYEIRNQIEFPALKSLDFKPGDRFGFRDDLGEHDPCYVVMPGGASIPLNHHAGPSIDVNRAKWIIETLNKELERIEAEEKCL